ncbi:MAG TPA: alpha/beta fold hydrolase [Chitinophagales bacterium]|nr:alpha/beta fold hydrolase [Chitinophagales bacterium]
MSNYNYSKGFKIKKLLFKTFISLIGLYFIACGLLYILQERLIFFPEKLAKNYNFDFKQSFQEINIKTKDSNLLNGLLFTTDCPNGLIFYLHGNAGNLSSWGDVAKTYIGLNYDVFIMDYRGYGKSESCINGQSQMFDDIQIAYNELKKTYHENEIIVLGYSIGTGLAAKLASENNPKLLILQAPYYSLTDMMKHTYPFVPVFLLKYKFPTNDCLKKCNMPVIVFHGNQDEVIYYGSSLKLKKEFKPNDTLITLTGQGHNGITENADYISAMKNLIGN